MRLHVSLTPSLEDFVRQKVAQGEYDSASEVVQEALRLKRGEELRGVDLQEKIQNGMASLRAGRAIPAGQVWTKLEKVVVIAEKRRGVREQ